MSPMAMGVRSGSETLPKKYRKWFLLGTELSPFTSNEVPSICLPFAGDAVGGEAGTGAGDGAGSS